MKYQGKIVLLVLLIIVICGGVFMNINYKKNIRIQERIAEENRQNEILRQQKEKEDMENTEKEEERAYMDKYVREHINDIAKQQAVLGGAWYVVSVKINTEEKNGEVVYEDGHLQAAADFSYTYDKASKLVTINK